VNDQPRSLVLDADGVIQRQPENWRRKGGALIDRPPALCVNRRRAAVLAVTLLHKPCSLWSAPS
jgi:hypothetical protein